MKRKKRGFAAMDPRKQRQLARLGGLAVSRNRLHMADIGMLGGQATQRRIRKLRVTRRKAA